MKYVAATLAFLAATAAGAQEYDVAEVSIERDGEFQWHTGDVILGDINRVVIRVHSHRTCISIQHPMGDFETSWCIEAPVSSCMGDLDGDNVVGGPDYTAFVVNFGRNCNVE